jgi:hypothetical protein
MKKLLIALGLMLAASQAHALWPSRVYEAVTSTVTVVSVNVSTSAATRMDPSVVGSRGLFQIQNQNGVNLFCGVSSSSTTLVASGFVIPSSGTWVTGFGDAIPVYCISAGAAASKTVVIQGY